jgi:large subunit ribosomal protein L35Ae
MSETQGIITSFRRGKETQYHKQMIVEVPDVETREDAKELVGKQVFYNTGKKRMEGEVTSAHGNSGALRVLFQTGMPGQSLGKPVKIE